MSELSEEQRELQARYALSDEQVQRVRGASWGERCEDAERLVQLENPPETLRERTLAHLERRLLAEKPEYRALIEAVHPTPDPEPSENAGDFDGGARPVERPPEPGHFLWELRRQGGDVLEPGGE